MENKKKMQMYRPTLYVLDRMCAVGVGEHTGHYTTLCHQLTQTGLGRQFAYFGEANTT